MHQRAGRTYGVELDAFPLVRLGAPSGHVFDLDGFFACADRAISRRARFVLLHDARGMPRLDAHVQHAFVAELVRRQPLIERFLLAYAAVVQSPLERGVVTALSWSTTLAFPRRIFAGEPEARAFLLDTYARVGPRKRMPSAQRMRRSSTS